MVVFLSDFYAEDRKIFPIVESPDCPDFFPQLEVSRCTKAAISASTSWSQSPSIDWLWRIFREIFREK